MAARPSLEERFLAELAQLRSSPESLPERTMMLRWKAVTEVGGPTSPKAEGQLIPSREVLQAYLYEPEAPPSARPVLLARLRGPDGSRCWEDWPPVVNARVHGRLEAGSALVVEARGCRLWSLHPSRGRGLRSPRRGAD